ncbi:MAG: ribonuclease P protein component [Candidatus Nomurabacteria bacterium]|jgi:ribonuclease P protein component|nr:ribonuclease P protein component [Candidatus Nomurabacteria bacterium]
MISNKYRFHGYGSLNYLHRNGQTARGGMMAARYAPNARRPRPRFAVVVSKKVYKSAVKRNRIRRRIYEIVRGYITPDAPSIDIALNVYSPEILTLPHAELKKQIHHLLKTAGFVI